MAETKIRLTQTDLNADSNKITGVSDGTVASDAATKGQLDTAVAGVLVLADFVYNETPAGILDGVNAVFTLANTPQAGTVRIYKNGQRLTEGATEDYTLAGGTITFASAPKASPGNPDVLLVDYIK